MTPRFDPTRAVIFDLARGQLRDDEGAARLNLPASLVLRLCESAGTAGARDLGHGLGAEVGRRIQARLGDDALSAPVEVWTEHLGGQLALLGLGNLRVERWGRALVLRVHGLPPGTQMLVGAVLEGALQRGLGKQAELVSFNDHDEVSYLALSAGTAARARELASNGASLASVVETLHRGAA